MGFNFKGVKIIKSCCCDVVRMHRLICATTAPLRMKHFKYMYYHYKNFAFNLYQYKTAFIVNKKYIDKIGWMCRLIWAINVSTWYEHIKILHIVCINAKLANMVKVCACYSLNRRVTWAAKILIRLCAFTCYLSVHWSHMSFSSLKCSKCLNTTTVNCSKHSLWVLVSTAS